MSSLTKLFCSRIKFIKEKDWGRETALDTLIRSALPQEQANCFTPWFGIRAISGSTLSHLLAILGTPFLFPTFWLLRQASKKAVAFLKALGVPKGMKNCFLLYREKLALHFMVYNDQKSQSNLYFKQCLIARQQDSHLGYKIKDLCQKETLPEMGYITAGISLSSGFGEIANHRDTLSAACE